MTEVQNQNRGTRNQPVRTKRPYDPTNNKGRGYGKLWAVYPDYWPAKWGVQPLLGFVRADSAFEAVYAAYDKGLSHPNNCTFGLNVVLQDRQAPILPRRNK